MPSDGKKSSRLPNVHNFFALLITVAINILTIVIVMIVIIVLMFTSIQPSFDDALDSDLAPQMLSRSSRAQCV